MLRTIYIYICMYIHLKIGGMYFGCKKEQYYEREMQIARSGEGALCIKKFYKNLLHFFYYRHLEPGGYMQRNSADSG